MNKPKIESKKPIKLNTQKAQITKAFNALFEPSPELNALDAMEYTGDIEKDAIQETELTGKTFSERAKLEQKRFELATDSEFWFAVCFQSREQKETFLKAMNWLQYGDKYLNGMDIADENGVSLPHVDLPKPKPFSKKLVSLVKRG